MSADQMLVDTASRIFADHCDKALLDASEAGRFSESLREVLAENGFFELAMRDSGFALADAFAVLRVAGQHAVPLPLAEIMLANRWLNQADEVATVGLGIGEVIADAPWARSAQVVLGIAHSGASAIVVRNGAVTEGANLAGESRDAVAVRDPADLDCGEDACYELLALARVAQTAGSLERILELCLSYANEREQFGRPIAKFQAVQHNLAVLAAEVAAAVRAGDAAVAALGGPRQRLEIAAAKARVGEAAGVVAEIAHQVHGAMGFTHEHQLHHFTRRAWAWRDEFGNDGYWRRQLGTQLAVIGADGVWDFIATRG
jgi:acyl-CoA dehydrogenase